MPRKRMGYDAACYYDGKLLGRCTKADSDAYTLLMNACGGDAARATRSFEHCLEDTLSARTRGRLPHLHAASPRCRDLDGDRTA